jgi:hypothetical protein
MDRAFELAREALSVGEVPVGCVLIYEGDFLILLSYVIQNLFFFVNVYEQVTV